VRASEWVAAGYFAYLCAAALIRPSWPRRWSAAATAFAATVALFLPQRLPDTTTSGLVRDWLPTLYIVVGYWLSGWFFVAPMRNIENRFLDLDRQILGQDSGSALVEALPRLVLEFLEFSYVTCFLFVPGGLLLLMLAGHRDAADRFWTLVLLGEFGSFAVLPWIQTRPPRTIEPPSAVDRRPLFMRQLNRLQIRTVSIGVNTFPSGHVAGALATAIAVGEVLPAWTPWLLAIVAAIAIAAVIGRYHFFIDAACGAGLTLLCWLFLRVLWQ
jgi:membrane-associated phospholipid phosphatase